MGKKDIQVWIPIPKYYKPDERVAIAQDVIDFIIKRTKDGEDKKGNPFPKYSKDYIKSLDFKNAGKSASQVNLTLSGDMLAALKILDEKPGMIKIGYDTSDPEAGRAEGNILGSYGGTPKKSRARDFLGISKDVLKSQILEKLYPIDDIEQIRRRTETVNQSGDQAQTFIEDQSG